MRPIAKLLAALVVSGCYEGVAVSQGGATAGSTSEGDTASGTDSEGEPMLPDDAAEEVGVSGLRRLSIGEYSATVHDLLGIDAANAREILPSDVLSPFDNDYTLQVASEPFVAGAELLAGDIAEAVIASPELRANVVPCEPSGPDDEACYREFVTCFGRRALRRTLGDEEIERFVALRSHGVAADDFWAGVAAGLRAFLQHPELLYRVEIGEPVADRPGLFRLNANEVGARLSYLLIGSTPPDWLLDTADAGDLDDPEGIADAAQRLLQTDEARARIDRFHALWLGWETLSRDGIYGQMHAETNALIERVVFDDRRPWTDLLVAEETWLTPQLAEHYGLPDPDGAKGWVPYGESGRAGLLSHGTFLSVGAKFGDTSPTQRGKLVRTQLFCQEIPRPPPDLMVDVDEPPMGSDPNACKHERYSMWKEDACKACHASMDPIGFGLESYDATGAFRATEVDRPECTIDGEGDFVGLGTFNGPAELAALAVESGLVEDCVAKQLYRFAIGRTELDDHDEALLERIVADASTDEGLELFALVSEYVSSEAFRHRREEETP